MPGAILPFHRMNHFISSPFCNKSRLKNILAQMGRENIKQVWSSVKKAYTLYGLVPLTQNQLFDTPRTNISISLFPCR